MHLSEFSSGRINPTELVSLLIIKGKDFVEGIENVFNSIKGSCSMLLLTEDGIIAARDRWGRTPIVVGKSDDAMAVTSESTAFPNLGFETVHYVGPGEIVRITADEMIQMRKPNEEMQICSFMWIYYGFPTSCYEGRNVEQMRNECGRAMGETDDVEVDCVCGIPDSASVWLWATPKVIRCHTCVPLPNTPPHGLARLCQATSLCATLWQR